MIIWAFNDRSNTWRAAEKAAYRLAFDLFAPVANITFETTETANSADANLEFINAKLTNTGNLGEQFGPNGQGNQGDGFYHPSGHSNWRGHLAQGGYAFLTVLHELGHGMGLAHPHDDAGGSGFFPGVDGLDSNGDPIPGKNPFGRDTGTDGRITGLSTVMSYNDTGERWAPGREQAFGYQGGLIAFDIAALQHIYGANTTYKTGNDSYALPDANVAGTFYSTIWDAGGTDTITCAGSGAASLTCAPQP